jgi:hypothetical protein
MENPRKEAGSLDGRLADDEQVLGTIEASFKQFHTFLDLLRDNESVLIDLQLTDPVQYIVFLYM